MSDEIADWEAEGGAIDVRPGVVMIVPFSSLEGEDSEELIGLITDMRRERVRIEFVHDHEWKAYQALLGIED